jgi:hypothetical protein
MGTTITKFTNGVASVFAMIPMFSYRQYASETGVTIDVQTSLDLQTWTTVSPPDISLQIGTDSTTGHPIMEVGVILTEASSSFA